MYWLFLPPAIISILSIFMLRSIAPDLVLTQALVALIGLCLAYAIQKVNSILFHHLARPVFVISLILLILTELGGVMSKGSTRWINFGLFRLQPSEMIKFSIILLLSRYQLVAKNLPKLNTLINTLAYILIPTLLILVQPDLGTAIMVLLVGAISVLLQKFPVKYYLVICAIALGFAGLIFTTLKDYQRIRITSFISGHSDLKGAGYNANQALISIGSGGWIGRGFGKGTQSRLKYLPERQTDFMFSSLVEEGGLLASLVVIGSYLFISIYTLSRVSMIKTTFDLHVVYMGLSLIFIQSLTNIAMNLGLIPIVGVTAPFLSYGGSSMLSSWVIIGLIQKSLPSHSYKRSLTLRF